MNILNAIERSYSEHSHSYRIEPEHFDAIRKLVEAAIDWAHNLDRIHEKVFIGAGPHEELLDFQAREKALRDLALNEFDSADKDA